MARPDYVKAAAVLAGVDMFDASFFGLSPRDVAIMDPQHRHFLECAWEAIENAGHPSEQFDGSIGVFAGCGTPSYLIHNLIHNRSLMDMPACFLSVRLEMTKTSSPHECRINWICTDPV